MKFRQATIERIEYSPGPKDCLAGRGGYTNHHIGTNKFRGMCEKMKLHYLLAKTIAEKQEIRNQLISEWENEGGRFLKGDPHHGFRPMSAKEVRRKTSQRLRERPDLFFKKLFSDEMDKMLGITMPEEPLCYDEDTLALLRNPISEFSL
ncbi:expressed unknown protein [Seminavis robusta]|uniref:DUF6824 domain-containing protein n=1 Tax=Seminavis robusta TaxID=568900 RepID=A0A9N8DKF7_9STRA|nr:expressed unknown protein [Seminavis robusta]|eukprot:Sro207_g086860.1 n/a (149) ;mRNA; r:47173-47619